MLYAPFVDPTPRVKMEDVARTAGVSVATVSKVVNGRYGVAQSTLDARAGGHRRARVRGEPRRAVACAATAPTSWASWSPSSSRSAPSCSRARPRAVGSTGYELLAYSGGGRGADVGWERRYLSRLSGTLIDGAIIVTPTVVEANTGVPVVAVDPHTGPTGLPTVDSDNYAGAVLATEHLIGLGHRRIGFLGGRLDLESARLREDGFRKAMDTAGLPVDESLVAVGGYRPETADAPARVLLGTPTGPPRSSPRTTSRPSR